MMKKEQDFDRLLMESLNEAPPDEAEIGRTNPWRIPFRYINWGIVLTTFHMNFLGLQYLLPFIGIFLLYLGFRSLRRENKWFQAAWICSIGNMVLHLTSVCLGAAPTCSSAVMTVWQAADVCLQFVFLLIFRNAVKDVLRKAGQETGSDPLLGAVLWYVVLTIFGFGGRMVGWPVFLVFGICFILILRSLREVGASLDAAGYCIGDTPVKIGAKWIAAGYGLICLTAVGVCCITANHLKVDGTAYARPVDSGLRRELTEMGFPEEILDCLSDADAELLEGAIYVKADSGRLVFDDIAERRTETEKTAANSVSVTTVYIEMANREIYVVHYFDWGERKAYWQDGFTVWAGLEGDELELLDGALFYEKDGTEYTAEFPRLQIGGVNTVSNLGGIPNRQIFGALSYPFGTKHQRGMIFYRMKPGNETQWLAATILNYAHQSHPFQFSYMETEQGMINGKYEYKQHYTLFEMEAYRKENGTAME